MNKFDHRSTENEIMDDLDSSGPVLDQALRELEFINKWLGGNAVTIDAISSLFRNVAKERPYKIIDVGCGGGDMAKHIYHWGKRNGYRFEVLGIDANPNVVTFAKKNVYDVPAISFQALNIFQPDFRRLQCDVVIGTLFYHHFTKDQLVEFFAALKGQVAIGFIINDIHRHPLAYHSIAMLTRMFSKSSMVQHDAPTSVIRAFKRKEVEEILMAAGYSNYRIRWKWAFRWEVIVWMK